MNCIFIWRVSLVKRISAIDQVSNITFLRNEFLYDDVNWKMTHIYDRTKN